IALLRKECGPNGQLTPIYHAKSRPNQTEAEAVNRLIYLSELAGYPNLYIVHTSTKEALDEIIIARKRGVKNLYCETCTQYLTLTEDEYKKEGYEGLKYIMSPPLRKNEDIEALWKGIEDGEVDVIATDHCPFFFERDKMYGKDDFRVTPGGAPGVEERMEVILTEGENRNIPKSKLVEILITNPAKIFGLYPTKGTLNIGSDGDVVLYDKKEYTISQKNRHSVVDYTTYEGFKSKYKVNTVIQRGNVIVEDGKLLVEKGQGKFIPRYK
ncbi:MAG: amidohydrolase family protein, partial [Tissierellia bacterium]|nr:amidohydrolase family protein [Tissierellia bacterium]